MKENAAKATTEEKYEDALEIYDKALESKFYSGSGF